MWVPWIKANATRLYRRQPCMEWRGKSKHPHTILFPGIFRSKMISWVLINGWRVSCFQNPPDATPHTPFNTNLYQGVCALTSQAAKHAYWISPYNNYCYTLAVVLPTILERFRFMNRARFGAGGAWGVSPVRCFNCVWSLKKVNIMSVRTNMLWNPGWVAIRDTGTIANGWPIHDQETYTSTNACNGTPEPLFMIFCIIESPDSFLSNREMLHGLRWGKLH